MSTSPKGSPLTIFCGKGGVGKTTMALAYALSHADQKRPVLLVTSHPLQELAVTVSLAGLYEAHPDAASNLFIIHIDPLEILASKVKQAVPSEFLVKKVLASPIYKSLIEVAPGLKEIAFLGRLHQLTEQRSREGKAGEYDLIVWDTPATGHFLQTLKVSQSFESYLSGPFGLLGKEVGEFFAEASNIALFPVTTLEEMAVDETIELCQKLDAELKVRPSGVICNMASPVLAAKDWDFDAVRDEMDWEGEGIEELKFIFERHAVERSLYRKVRSSIFTQFHIIERRPSWNSDLDLLAGLSRELRAMLGN
jgi:anion-transporting  ArsA/GET3 family ATPase